MPSTLPKIVVVLPQDLFDRLTQASALSGAPKAEITRRALAEWMDKRKVPAVAGRKRK